MVGACPTDGRDERFSDRWSNSRWRDIKMNQQGTTAVASGMDSSASKKGPVMGSYEHGNGHLGSIQGR